MEGLGPVASGWSDVRDWMVLHPKKWIVGKMRYETWQPNTLQTE